MALAFEVFSCLVCELEFGNGNVWIELLSADFHFLLRKRLGFMDVSENRLAQMGTRLRLPRLF